MKIPESDTIAVGDLHDNVSFLEKVVSVYGESDTHIPYNGTVGRVTFGLFQVAY